MSLLSASKLLSRHTSSCNTAQRLFQIANAKLLTPIEATKAQKMVGSAVARYQLPSKGCMSTQGTNHYQLGADLQSCDRNARRLWYLRLPVEIRVRIYEIVIGGHHLQIEFKPHDHRRYQKEKIKYHEHIVGGLFYFTIPHVPYLNRPFELLTSEQSSSGRARFNIGKRVTLLSRVSRPIASGKIAIDLRIEFIRLCQLPGHAEVASDAQAVAETSYASNLSALAGQCTDKDVPVTNERAERGLLLACWSVDGRV